jgi:hypothetical protein
MNGGLVRKWWLIHILILLIISQICFFHSLNVPIFFHGMKIMKSFRQVFVVQGRIKAEGLGPKGSGEHSNETPGSIKGGELRN